MEPGVDRLLGEKGKVPLPRFYDGDALQVCAIWAGDLDPPAIPACNMKLSEDIEDFAVICACYND
jgi:hypothetical protein